MPTARHATLAALVALGASGDVCAQAAARGGLFAAPPSLDRHQPEDGADPDGADREVPELAAYGQRDSQWLTAGVRYADDFKPAVDVSLFLQYSVFVEPRVELGGELAGWVAFQDDDTVAGSFSLLGRYHFLQRERWSLFAEGSLGVFYAEDTVPDAGTKFNLLPRLGFGGTYELGPGTRLIGGVHWHHISNARTSGADRNPARDAIGLFVAVTWAI
ncbi:MAG: acyloxyacyl hydrolase [Planctomycetota bacterium]